MIEFTFGTVLSLFVIVMFLIVDWLYPVEDAITDMIEVTEELQSITLRNEVLCRGINDDDSMRRNGYEFLGG